MKNLTQSKLKRNIQVKVPITSDIPYNIQTMRGESIGKTLQDGAGVYLKQVRFVKSNGQPAIVGLYLGDISEDRLNISDGQGVSFDKELNEFVTEDGVIKSARMVQLYNGIIKVVIK